MDWKATSFIRDLERCQTQTDMKPIWNRDQMLPFLCRYTPDAWNAQPRWNVPTENGQRVHICYTAKSRYTMQSKNWRCLDFLVGVLRLASIWVLDVRFWIGVSRPISNRYRIQKKRRMLPGFPGGSSQICFYMSFGCEILDRSLQTDIKPIQNPKQKLLFENPHLSYGMWQGARLRPIWNRYETETKCYLSCVGNLYTPDTWNAQPRKAFPTENGQRVPICYTAKSWYRMQSKDWCCLDSWVRGLRFASFFWVSDFTF